MTLITSSAKFLTLAAQEKIFQALKTFNDTILFYYLGTLALRNKGNIFEVGCGGSTNALYELSDVYGRRLILCDLKEVYLKQHLEFYPEIDIKVLLKSSLELTRADVGAIVYSHIDGSKHYDLCKPDLDFAIDNIADYGLICQDDYGNNKWPTITNAVNEKVNEGRLKFVLIGDSSAWLTTPEFYDYWMNVLSSDREFNILSTYIGINESSKFLGYHTNYYYINSMKPHQEQYLIEGKTFSQKDIDYLLELETIRLNSKFYLKMPYSGQSTPGQWISKLKA